MQPQSHGAWRSNAPIRSGVMSVKSTSWLVVAALVTLGVVALTQQVRIRSLEAAEAEASELIRRSAAHAVVSTALNPQQRTELTHRIYFGFDRYVIQPVGTEILDRKIAILLAHPRVRVRIVGHCDEQGDEIYNLALGRRRAVAARDYLVEHGVDPRRIETVSAGEGQPVDLQHSGTAWGWNRRDEFQVLDGDDLSGRDSGALTADARQG